MEGLNFPQNREGDYEKSEALIAGVHGEKCQKAPITGKEEEKSVTSFNRQRIQRRGGLGAQGQGRQESRLQSSQKIRKKEGRKKSACQAQDRRGEK